MDGALDQEDEDGIDFGIGKVDDMPIDEVC
jgi:hypothetical protein